MPIRDFNGHHHTIYPTLFHHGLNTQTVQGREYDVSSNMRVKLNNLQTLILQECPYTYYPSIPDSVPMYCIIPTSVFMQCSYDNAQLSSKFQYFMSFPFRFPFISTFFVAN
jgi:hypothetical protein